jgi:hypothetical protein
MSIFLKAAGVPNYQDFRKPLVQLQKSFKKQSVPTLKKDLEKHLGLTIFGRLFIMFLAVFGNSFMSALAAFRKTRGINKLFRRSSFKTIPKYLRKVCRPDCEVGPLLQTSNNLGRGMGV